MTVHAHNFGLHLLTLAKANGLRRRVVRLRPVKPKLNLKRELRSIINQMVAAVYQHAPDLIAAATVRTPTLDSDGEVIGIFRDTVDDIDRLLDLIVTQTQTVMTRLQLRVRGWSQRVNEEQRKAFTESIFASTKISADLLLNPAYADRTVQHYVTWATSLIQNVGDEARSRIGGAVLAAVREGTSPRELAKTIREYEDMSYRRAKNIAADQTTKLYSALNQARQQELGITHFTWIHSGSPHPREEHLERDGEVFAWDDNEIDTGDYPGEPPFCGCTAQATLIDETGAEVDTGEDVVEEE